MAREAVVGPGVLEIRAGWESTLEFADHDLPPATESECEEVLRQLESAPSDPNNSWQRAAFRFSRTTPFQSTCASSKRSATGMRMLDAMQPAKCQARKDTTDAGVEVAKFTHVSIKERRISKRSLRKYAASALSFTT